MNNPIRKLSSWLFGNIETKIKAILFIIISIAAGHLCDDYFQGTFPVFKIAFGLVGLMVFIVIQNNLPDDGGKEQE